jgi:hypothetical protein
MDMDEDSQVLDYALRSWQQFHSPPSFVVAVLPIIRDASTIDQILSHLSAKSVHG